MANAMGQELQVVWPVFGICLANSQATCLEHAVGVMPLVRMQAKAMFTFLSPVKQPCTPQTEALAKVFGEKGNQIPDSFPLLAQPQDHCFVRML